MLDSQTARSGASMSQLAESGPIAVHVELCTRNDPRRSTSTGSGRQINFDQPPISSLHLGRSRAAILECWARDARGLLGSLHASFAPRQAGRGVGLAGAPAAVYQAGHDLGCSDPLQESKSSMSAALDRHGGIANPLG